MKENSNNNNNNNNIDSAVLQTARCLETEVQREAKKMKDSIKQKKDGTGRGCMGNYHVTYTKSWLKSDDIKGEIESKIVAAQDQEISTNYFKNKILKEETESKCRLCK
jgi:hypothetical protein